MKVINDKKRLLFTLKEKTSGPLVVASEELILVEESTGGETPTPVDSRPYKVYTALLTHSGTNAPVATVLENTLGVNISWVRLDIGIFRGNVSGSIFNDISTNKISLPNYLEMGTSNDTLYQRIYDIYVEEGDIQLNIRSNDDPSAVEVNKTVDGFIKEIEIRVYN